MQGFSCYNFFQQIRNGKETQDVTKKPYNDGQGATPDGQEIFRIEGTAENKDSGMDV